MNQKNYEEEKAKIFEIVKLDGFGKKKIHHLIDQMKRGKEAKQFSTLSPIAEPEKKNYRKFNFHPRFGHKFKKNSRKFSVSTL